MKKLEIEIPEDYLTELKTAAEEAQITLNSQVMVAIATWIYTRIDADKEVSEWQTESDARRAERSVPGGI